MVLVRIRSIFLDSIKPLFKKAATVDIEKQARYTRSFLRKQGLQNIKARVTAGGSGVELHLPEGYGQLDAIHLRAMLTLAFAGMTTLNGKSPTWTTVRTEARRAPVLPPVKRRKYKLRLEIDSAFDMSRLLDVVTERLHHDAIGGRMSVFLD